MNYMLTYRHGKKTCYIHPWGEGNEHGVYIITATEITIIKAIS